MNKEFIQVTKGILPTAVLTLLAIAFISGQAQSNVLLAEVVKTAEFVEESLDSNNEVIRTFESLPAVVDSLVTLPNDFPLHVLLPRDAVSGEILTNQKLRD